MHMCSLKVGLWLPAAGGTGKWGMAANGYRVSLGEDRHFLKLDSGDGYTAL